MGEPYDFRSIMHYSAMTDPEDPNRHTMTYKGTNDIVKKPSGWFPNWAENRWNERGSSGDMAQERALNIL